MNQHLQSILNFIEQDKSLSAEEKSILIKLLKDANKELEITSFKLDRTEKVKRTTAILLEETIEELEQKRKAVEAQNRELEIEAALEKVRSRSLAVHKSDEFKEVIKVVFEKLQEMEIPVEAASINIFIEGSKDIDVYACGLSENGLDIKHVRLCYFDNPIANDLYNAHKNGLDFFVGTYGLKEKNSYYQYQFKHSALKDLPADIKERILQSERYNLSMALSKNSIIIINNFDGKLLSETEIDIVKRFARVFEQAYIRFLDLQKAEAQAREAQIELALERVRARTMAMQKSEELPEAANLLFQQMQALGMPAWSAGYCIWDEDKKGITLWMSSEGVMQPSFHAPLTEDPSFIHMREAYERGETFHVESVGGEELITHYKYMRTLPDIGKILDSIIEAGYPLPTFQIFHCVYFSQGFLLFITYQPVTEAHNIFKRFAKVFEQTFTRFLDLQKAEVQAREAQIEGALERVRSKTMAMHHSDDLLNVITTLTEQLQQLGFRIDTANFNTNYRNKDWELWSASNGTAPIQVRVPYFNHPIFNKIISALDDGEDFFADTLDRHEKDSFLKHLFENTIYKNLSEEAKKDLWRTEGFTYSIAFSKHTSVTIGNYEPLPYNKQQNGILRRFGNVFEQSYTRFLDLQKAEAQAREAQIEAALERTRTQSMMMQHSEQLDDTLRVFHEQVLLLGIPSAFSFLWLPDEKNDKHIFWAAWAENNLANFKSKAINYPLDRNEPATAQCLIDWKGTEPIVSYYVPASGVENYFAAWQELINGVEHLKSEHFSDGLYYVEAFMKYGCFGVMVTNDLSDDEKNILGRLAIEFERTYTRFLDLKKAEEQAKEARIETALERVRAVAMAMKKSEELATVNEVMFNELRLLGFTNIRNAQIAIENEERESFISYVHSDNEDKVVREAPYSSSSLLLNAKQQLNTSGAFYEAEYTGTDLDEWRKWRKSTGAPLDERELSAASLRWYLYAIGKGHIGISTFNEISAGQLEIVKRFKNVFELSYTRFDDLQKAEAQTREAEIELALERVRARTMAMQKSDELREAVLVIYEQLQQLGFDSNACNIIIIDEESGAMQYWVSGFTQEIFPEGYHVPYLRHPYHETLLEASRQKKKYAVMEYSGKMKKSFDEIFFTQTDFRNIPEEAKKFMRGLDSVTLSTAFFSFGALQILGPIELTGEKAIILQRFAKVFEQTYTRFLDLQNAEAQARESQIQLALERVRARTMAMQKSDELSETAHILFKQFKQLGDIPLQITIGIFNEEKKLIEFRITGLDGSGSKIDQTYNMDIDEPVLLHKVYTAWKEQRKSVIIELTGKDLRNWSDYKSKMGGVTESALDISEDERRFVSVGFFSKGMISFSKRERISEETIKILERFATVFDQTYTRFLDIQKAEAQAREAQIEAALERVRSRSMGMQKSDELKEVIQIVYEQFVHLNINVEHTGFIMNYKERDDMLIWLADKHAVPFQITIPYFDCAHWNSFNEAKATGMDFFANHLSFEEKNKFYQHLFKLFPVPDEAQKYYFSCPGLAISTVLLDNVGLYIENFSGIPYSDEDNKTLMRFGKVFQQTYTRFNDLKQAEASAREAKIEAALEKVRSRTMAMQKSSELADTATVLFKEMNLLVDNLWLCGFVLCDKDSAVDEWWLSGGNGFLPDLYLPRTGDALHENMYNAWLNGKTYYAEAIEGDALQQHYDWLMTIPSAKKAFESQAAAGIEKPVWQQLSCAYFSYGYLVIITQQPCNEDQIFKRFAQVFDQTYTRFLDLQKAEAQARQAKIEAAMEKVRSRAMAMQKPDELVQVAQLLRTEMGLLGVEELETSSIYIHHEDTQKTECWYAIKDVQHPDKELVSDHMTINLDETTVGKQMLQFYHSGKKQISIPMQGDARKEWINYCADHSKVLAGFYGDAIPDRTYHLYKFANGFMGAASPGNISAESWDLLQRATTVFSLAYTRFNDLQQAEAQAREAKVEAALERVRSRTLAMQKSDELAETAAVLFQQLISLGISPNRLYINVVKDENGEAEFWITDEDGNKVSMAYEDNLNNNPSFKKMFDGWKQQKKSLVIDMKGGELQQYFKYLSSIHVPFKGGLTQNRRLQYIAYFSRGFIGMASPDEQPVETLQLLERFAYVFNLTFTRFNDLQIAEAHALQAEHDLIEIKAARKKAEETLAELQSTQKQLIQSEKMASLGELTAGIAHEIQNPLNFVNNFSEVSKELLDEMKAALENGNKEEADEIANDIIQNLEKINHHGKRADAIVKGMLQHSRKDTGQKEPTDINALCNEYIRLCYHGLRAKDKAFNADFKTDFDTTIEKIKVVQQDISRVLLNVLTNAFYAVNEKQKNLSGLEDLTGLVAVQTKKVNDTIEIRVSDNGNGIPSNIINKIFQPFFTTKPTGQGTGLGLSIAYDIITKEHNGTIKVESKEGEGTTFTISLPFI